MTPVTGPVTGFGVVLPPDDPFDDFSLSIEFSYV
jgi:hypothetical protein